MIVSAAIPHRSHLIALSCRSSRLSLLLFHPSVLLSRLSVAAQRGVSPHPAVPDIPSARGSSDLIAALQSHSRRSHGHIGFLIAVPIRGSFYPSFWPLTNTPLQPRLPPDITRLQEDTGKSRLSLSSHRRFWIPSPDPPLRSAAFTRRYPTSPAPPGPSWVTRRPRRHDLTHPLTVAAITAVITLRPTWVGRHIVTPTATMSQGRVADRISPYSESAEAQGARRRRSSIDGRPSRRERLVVWRENASPA